MQMTILVSVNRLEASAESLAQDYKARGVERQASYSQFVIDRGLNPEMDAKEFMAIFDRVSPHLLMEYKQIDYISTHHDTELNIDCMIVEDAWGFKIVWDNGMTGHNPPCCPPSEPRFTKKEN